MENILSRALLPCDTKIKFSSNVLHRILSKSVYESSKPFEFFCHTVDGEENPFVIIELPLGLEFRNLYLVNRYKEDAEGRAVADKINGVQFAVSSDCKNWREVQVEIKEENIYNGLPLIIETEPEERFIKAFKIGRSCSAIHFSKAFLGFKKFQKNYNATSDFAKRFSLSLNASGEIVDGRDEVAIYSPCNASSSSQILDAVVIEKLGRFGNALIQLRNAIVLADALGVENVIIMDKDAVEKIFLRNEFFNFGNVKVSVAKESLDSINILLGSFFYSQLANAVLLNKGKSSMPISSLAPFLDFYFSKPFDESVVVIHIRSGDVFIGENVHRGYGQPPLAFYMAVLNIERPQKAVLVFEDKSNPVIDGLIEFCARECIDIECCSGNLHDDISIIMRAQFLVCGHGTFVPVVAGLSCNVRKIFLFEKIVALGVPNVAQFLVIDNLGVYRDSILNNNWANTPSQRELMLTYDESFLAIKKV